MPVKSARPAQLYAHLKREPLARVYLLAGQEPLLLLEAADAVRAAARAQGFAEREVLESGESHFDWGALAAATQQASLFGDSRKLIDLRIPTGKPGKDGAEALKAYAAQAAADAVLLVTCTQWGKAFETAWVDALAARGWYVPVWPVKRGELPGWITARARDRGLTLDDDAVAMLAERTEGNLLACAQEIEKLSLLAKNGRIDGSSLDVLLAQQSRLDIFALSDAVLAGETARALRVLRSLHAEGESPVPITGWLGGQVELLARVLDGAVEGRSIGQGLRTERVWDARVPMYESALARLGRPGVRRALVAFARLDRIGKGQEAGDPWLELERIVMTLSGATRRRRASP